MSFLENFFNVDNRCAARFSKTREPPGTLYGFDEKKPVP